MIFAAVRDDFAEGDERYTFNNLPALSIDVYRVGEQTPTGVAEAVKQLLPQLRGDLPENISLEIVRDSSEVYQSRLDLLLKNAFIGLMLVMIMLGVFLDFRLAFWVTLGIPTAFLGAVLFLPLADVSINMMSMFAFILALGIVVDDAIIAGENIYEYRQRGYSNIEAAIEGVRTVAVPLTFSILTNIIAFTPLYFLPGFLGKIFMVMPVVVACVFLVSWVEALIILPAHLSGSKRQLTYSTGRFKFWHWVNYHQQKLIRALNKFIKRDYRRFLIFCIRWRGTTIALAVAIFIVTMAYSASGRLGFTFDAQNRI